MANRGGNKKEIDPEELMRRKFRAKCRFRALGRLVMANTYWLIEGIDEYEGVEDVKRRVAQAVRKAKKKQLLNITDKALLNKPADDRTDHEKKYIYRIIGGLKCFKRYPNHVKRKLAAVTYFKYYGPGRVIVRQHHEAHALYFIVTGDVVVSQMILDELIQQYISVDIGAMHAGDMFGEVSLLHNIPRTATCTTVGHCEVLALMKEDFKNVLQASVQKQWDEVRRAMSAFTYFDALDEVARREGCIVAKMKSYEINATLLGDGVGVPNFVYFVLSGKCQMIESMQVIVTKRLGRTYYTLHDPYVPPVESEQDFDTKYFGAYKDRLKSKDEVSKETSTSTKESEKLSDDDKVPKERSKRLESILKRGSIKSRSSKLDSTGSKHLAEASVVINPEVEIDGKRVSSQKRDDSVVSISKPRSSSIKSSQLILQPRGSARELRSGGRPPTRWTDDLVKVAGSRWMRSARDRTLWKFMGEAYVQQWTSVADRYRWSALPAKPQLPNIRTYFMQVCQFNPGSTFGFGENMRDRRIVALTPVDCMLMPKIWLLQRNTANIWSRIEHYLDKKIPTKKQLFAEFVSERRWQEFRDQLVEDVVARSNTVNSTSIHDVPYSIRMEEMLDI